MSEATIKISADLSDVETAYATAKEMMRSVDMERRQMVRQVARDVTQSVALMGNVRTLTLDIMRMTGIVIDAHSQALIASIGAVIENFTRMVALYYAAGGLTMNVALLGIASALSVAVTIYALQSYGQTDRMTRETMSRMQAAERSASIISTLWGVF